PARVLARLRSLCPCLRRYRGKLALGLATILAATVFGLLAPILVGRGVDALKTSLAGGTVLRYALLIVATALVQGVFTYLQRLVLVTMSLDIEFDLRNVYFAHLEPQP